MLIQIRKQQMSLDVIKTIEIPRLLGKQQEMKKQMQSQENQRKQLL